MPEDQTIDDTPLEPPSDAPPSEKMEAPAPKSELEQLKIEIAECKEKYLRVLAESENARKRMQKERQELVQFAVQNVIVDFLSPIDHLENALKFAHQMSDEVKRWAIGFQMILNQFKEVLTNHHVRPFKSEGMQFDPHSHEALETIATNDYAPGIVVSESVVGYKMGDRTIRPARVKVSKELSEVASQEKQENTQE
jgi:molecular chaperone GrpE